MFFLKELPTPKMVKAYQKTYGFNDPEKVLKTLQTMQQASYLLRDLEAYFAKHNLSQLKFLIMVVIDRELEEKTLTISELLDRIDVSKPVMTRTLKVMAENNLISIQENKEDKRSKRVSLSRKSKDLLEQILPDYYKIIENFTDNKTG